jgi:hypothetical protein
MQGITKYITAINLTGSAYARQVIALYFWVQRQGRLFNALLESLNRINCIVFGSVHEFLTKVFICYRLENLKTVPVIKLEKHDLFNYHYLPCMIYSGCV